MLGWVNSLYNSMFSSSIESKFNRYGWKKGEKYNQFEKYVFNSIVDHIKLVDLRDKCPSVYDQGHLGSCTANSIAFSYHYDEIKQNVSAPFIPSRLFIYYNERNMEGHVAEDSGAEIHDGIQSINTIGVCNEADWPYDITKFTDKPTQNCYDEAKLHQTKEFKAVKQNLEQLKAAIIEGYPVVFGFQVYESFESPDVAKTGIMPIPKDNEKILGGHAVAVVGFDDSKKVFIVRNSWGETWGDKGYFYMPYEFIVNPDMASDFWFVSKIADNSTQTNLEEHLKTKIVMDKIISSKNQEISIIEPKKPECFIVTKRNKRNKQKLH